MTDKPSRGLPGEFGLALLPDKLGLPNGNVIKIVRLNLTAGHYIDPAHEVGSGDLRLDRSFDGTDERLSDAAEVRDPALGFILPFAPCRKPHRSPTPEGLDAQYVVPLCVVNNDSGLGGNEYNVVAYVYAMHPGNRIRELRRKAGLTQAGLGERLGLQQETISQYENGRRPVTLEHLRAIARELGCAPADLLVDQDNPGRLSDPEQALIESFRAMNVAEQAVISTSAAAVADRRIEYDARKVA